METGTFQMWFYAHLSNISIKMLLVNRFMLQRNILYMEYLFSELRQHSFVSWLKTGLFGLKLVIKKLPVNLDKQWTNNVKSSPFLCSLVKNWLIASLFWCRPRYSWRLSFLSPLHYHDFLKLTHQTKHEAFIWTDMLLFSTSDPLIASWIQRRWAFQALQRSNYMF